MIKEITRTRNEGTKVTVSKTPEEKIRAIRDVVTNSQYAKVDGVMVDLFTASAITQVHDAISEENRLKYIAMPVAKMASIAFQLMK